MTESQTTPMLGKQEDSISINCIINGVMYEKLLKYNDTDGNIFIECFCKNMEEKLKKILEFKRRVRKIENGDYSFEFKINGNLINNLSKIDSREELIEDIRHCVLTHAEIQCTEHINRVKKYRKPDTEQEGN